MTFHASHTEVEERLLTRALPAGCRVLDAGCGRTTRLAAHRDTIGRLVGADLDGAAIAGNAALDEAIRADLCRPLPFVDGAFDVVYANFVVEHLDHPARAFAEWRRVLRSDGALILLTPNVASPLLAASTLLPDGVRRALKRRGAGVATEDVIPVRYRANTPGRLDTLLRRAGFAPVEVEHVATLHRYAERMPIVAAALRGLERLLPARLRSTIVAWYQAV